MRPCLVLFAALAAAAAPVPAEAQHVRVGVIAGASLANFSGSGAESDLRSGMTVGGTLAYDLSSIAEIRTGIVWVQKGGMGTVQGFHEALRAAYALEYLQIPLLVQFSVPTGAALRPTLHLGPAASFEVDCDVDVRETSELLLSDGCVGAGGRRTTELGILMGGGLAYDLGSASVTLEGTYDMGLSDLRQPEGDVKNRAFTLVTGISVPVGSRAGR